MPEEGEIAPDFKLIDHEGNEFSLSSFRSKYLVLYFYPRAMTPGCTREAVRFNELLEEFRSLGAEVVGVSTDPPDRLGRFAEKYGLGFRLLSDPEGEVAGMYGVLRQGKRVSAERVTFILDGKRRILKVLRDIRPAERHADLSLEFLRSLR